MAVIDWESVIKVVGPIIAAIFAAGGIGGVWLNHWLKKRDKKQERREEAVKQISMAESAMSDVKIEIFKKRTIEDKEDYLNCMDVIAVDITEACVEQLRWVFHEFNGVVSKKERNLLKKCIKSAETILMIRDNENMYERGGKADQLYTDVLSLRDMMIGKM
ncbi:MAG: hypothetical protein JXM70_15595 [Pirellulales bacterium]|nr:hypothetical protein [Pirellulales bacterium]